MNKGVNTDFIDFIDRIFENRLTDKDKEQLYYLLQDIDEYELDEETEDELRAVLLKSTDTLSLDDKLLICATCLQSIEDDIWTDSFIYDSITIDTVNVISAVSKKHKKHLSTVYKKHKKLSKLSKLNPT